MRYRFALLSLLCMWQVPWIYCGVCPDLFFHIGHGTGIAAGPLFGIHSKGSALRPVQTTAFYLKFQYITSPFKGTMISPGLSGQLQKNI